MPAPKPLRVVVLIQENKTPDFYFPSLAKWGADVNGDGPLLAAAPDYDQPHDRSAWVHYKMGDYPAVHARLDDERVIPYYSWLAKTFTFCDHHVGLGANSTSGHLLAIGGQTPTLKNPPFGPGGPQWDLPSILVHAEQHGVSWAAIPDQDGYPTKFYRQLRDPARAAHLHPASPGGPDPFVTMAAAGTLPRLVYAWSPEGYDEHPPFKTSDPDYLTRGQDFIWKRVDAVVKAGEWANTVFILTYDDWGGYADHVTTPGAQLVPDALHPNGFQVLAGSRLPLLMFGGRVRQGIESSWHSHATIVKTVVDLLGLPRFGVRNVDTAPSLAGRVDPKLKRPAPPPFGSTVTQPTPPKTPPAPTPPGPWPGKLGVPMPPLVTASGGTLPAPTDGLVRPKPPKLPPQAPSG